MGLSSLPALRIHMGSLMREMEHIDAYGKNPASQA